MRSTDNFAFEFSLDLTTQELLTMPPAATTIEIEDIGDVEPLYRGAAPAANAERARIEDSAGAVEIELTAEQVLALLTDGVSDV
ncbi:MAG: hypothetical protein GX535_06240 [Xanthomonadaceae bacterium]|nr:hypothetical protein [Xanthomonadaceae bacterium]